MLRRNDYFLSQPVVWVRDWRGGPGYGVAAPGRVVRSNATRVTVLVYREADRTWLFRSVGRAELRPATRDESSRMELLEADDRGDHPLPPDLARAA